MLSRFWLLVFGVLFSFHLLAYDTKRTLRANEAPHELKGIKVDEKIGDSIDLNLEFINEKGEKIQLKSYFKTNKPVLFTIVYYMCPSLCQLHLNSVVKNISRIGLKDDFEFIALSMDHKESFELAQKKKENYFKKFKINQNQFHFLTGSKENIEKISRQVGFRFKWNEKEKQFAHLPVAYALTPEGKISRYIYGVDLDEKTLKLSLVEASQGKIGGAIERILLFCFKFDPTKNRYTLYAYNIMRAGAVVTVLLILILLGPFWLRKSS